MLSTFMGRSVELALLSKRLDRVAAAGSGIAVAIRGRRQVGKSRLVQELCNRAQVPYLFFTAVKGASPVESINSFLRELQESSLPAQSGLVPTEGIGGWLDLFRIVSSVLPDTPTILVIDELPWLAEQDSVFYGALQKAWDRLLSQRPVLLLLLGSDIHMMERLTAYDRPFFGRADNLVLGPLNPAETGHILDLDASDALDAYLISGGLPGILRSWPRGMPALSFIESECNDPASPLFSVPESTLAAEFPLPDQTRRVLEAVGSGERTHATIAALAGSSSTPLPSGSLSPLLQRLVDQKRVLATDTPLSTQPGKPTLYRIADSNLRLYLAILRHAQELIYRGQYDAAFRLVSQRWTAWRGRAIEPVVRQSLALSLTSPDSPWPETEVVGGWWNRQFNPEIDLVGADMAPVAKHILWAGSIKWLNTFFDNHDLTNLMVGAAQIPGFDLTRGGLVIVSRSGIAPGLALRKETKVLGADDIVAAWSSGRTLT